MEFLSLPKLKKNDRVAILSPSFAASGRWPHIHELGCQRLREKFNLEPVEFPSTRKIGATAAERSKDLIDAFEDKNIKAVIASLGGDDQVTYIKNLPSKPFIDNPKPFFGYSDNTHLINFLWQNGIPSFYGGHLFTEFAMQVEMDDFTVKYLKHAFFDQGFFDLESSPIFNDINLDWNILDTINQKRRYQPNDAWYWDGIKNAEGITWGGCLESVDELLRHGITIPTLKNFENIVLFLESSEEIPSSEYVYRILRALGERGILKNIQALLIGRPKAWEFNKPNSDEEKDLYKKTQREIILNITRKHNSHIPIIQNLDFGHTAPQICLPVGKKIIINSSDKSIKAEF